MDRRNFLFDILPKNCICAEIGVWKGGFSQEILDNLSPRKLYLIDPWLYQPSYSSSWYGGGYVKSQEDMDHIYNNVYQKFKADSRVTILRKKSSHSIKIFPDKYFDFAYIDGNHSYDFVKQDIELFYPKIKENGWIIGDDYGNNGWWNNGVQKAIDEFIKTNDLKLTVTNNQFIIKKDK
jgi:hypothetical protein